MDRAVVTETTGGQMVHLPERYHFDVAGLGPVFPHTEGIGRYLGEFHDIAESTETEHVVSGVRLHLKACSGRPEGMGVVVHNTRCEQSRA